VLGAATGGLFGLLGAREQEESAEGIHRENVAAQREFAQQGIRWRVEDAKAAGLHPLFALGGSGATYSPSSYVGGETGRAISEMGQNVGRAISAQQTPAQREAAALQLEILKNQVKAGAIANIAAEHELSQKRNAGALSAAPMQQGAPVAEIGSLTTQHPDVRASQVHVGNWPMDVTKVNPSETTSFSSTDRSLAAATGTANKLWVVRDRDGKQNTVILPDANSFSEALEAISENYALGLIYLNLNIDANPNFLDEMRGVIPFAGAYHDMSAWIDRQRGRYGFRGGDFSGDSNMGPSAPARRFNRRSDVFDSYRR